MPGACVAGAAPTPPLSLSSLNERKSNKKSFHSLSLCYSALDVLCTPVWPSAGAHLCRPARPRPHLSSLSLSVRASPILSRSLLPVAEPVPALGAVAAREDTLRRRGARARPSPGDALQLCLGHVGQCGRGADTGAFVVLCVRTRDKDGGAHPISPLCCHRATRIWPTPSYTASWRIRPSLLLRFSAATGVLKSAASTR